MKLIVVPINASFAYWFQSARFKRQTATYEVRQKEKQAQATSCVVVKMACSKYILLVLIHRSRYHKDAYRLSV